MGGKAVVLLSGGLDSTTALYWSKSKGYAPVALCVDYGQRHARELNSARRVARKAHVPLHEARVNLPWLKVSSLLNKDLALPDMSLSKIGRSIPTTYVPGRNTVFLALGVSLADAIGAQAVVLGANVLDYSGYPDCRPEYLKAFAKVAALGARSAGIKIVAPLIHLDKSGIIKLARKVAAPLELTWSCYAGGRAPCGRCDSCKLRAKGFEEAKAADPAAA